MYRWGTLVVVLVHFLYAVLAEEFIAKNTLVQRSVKMLRGKHLPKSKFKVNIYFTSFFDLFLLLLSESS